MDLCQKVAQKVTEQFSSGKRAPGLWVVTEEAGRLFWCQIFKVCGGRSRANLTLTEGKKCHHEDGVRYQ